MPKKRRNTKKRLIRKRRSTLSKRTGGAKTDGVFTTNKDTKISLMPPYIYPRSPLSYTMTTVPVTPGDRMQPNLANKKQQQEKVLRRLINSVKAKENDNDETKRNPDFEERLKTGFNFTGNRRPRPSVIKAKNEARALAIKTAVERAAGPTKEQEQSAETARKQLLAEYDMVNQKKKGKGTKNKGKGTKKKGNKKP